MNVNPYESPAQAPRPTRRSGTVSIAVGSVLLFLAFAGLTQGIHSPPNSRGDLMEDLPFIVGELSVPFVLIAVGSFLLWRGFQARKKRKSQTDNV
jgi:hypothetical protein